MAPSRFHSFVLRRPANRVRREQPPQPGVISQLISGMPQRERSVATTKSHTSVSSRPPPVHTPSTAAIVMGYMFSMMWTVSWYMLTCHGPSFGPHVLISLMSSPAQKVLPAPLKSTTRHAPPPLISLHTAF